MYNAHWGLTDQPFENTPDPRFLYRSAQYNEAYVRILYVIQEHKGAGMLTGIFGCGKTLVSQALRHELKGERYHTIYLAHPRLSDVEFLRLIAHQLGITPLPTDKAESLITIEAALSDNLRNGKETVILVDEAHAIDDPGMFEELRLLLNFQSDQRFLLTLLLFGQPELIAKVNALKPLEQRIAMKCHLEGLSMDDMVAYIQHRLQVAGRTEPIFTVDALQTIYEHTGGIPRRINRLCDVSLLAGFVAQVQEITSAQVLEEVQGLGGGG